MIVHCSELGNGILSITPEIRRGSINRFFHQHKYMNKVEKMSITQTAITFHALIGKWARNSEVMARNTIRVLWRECDMRRASGKYEPIQTYLHRWNTMGKLNIIANTLGDRGNARCTCCSNVASLGGWSKSILNHWRYNFLLRSWPQVRRCNTHWELVHILWRVRRER